MNGSARPASHPSVGPPSADESGSSCRTSCTSDSDCTTYACDAVSHSCILDQCADQQKDGSETDVDCGGGTCHPCGFDQACQVDTDCTTSACDFVTGLCAANMCSDRRQDGSETDVDCGGGTCPTCPSNERCVVNGDCTSNICDAGVCQ